MIATRRPLRPLVAASLLREGRPVELPLGGSSMRPLLAPGQLIRVDPASADDVRIGDVVVVDVGGQLVCHRLLYRTADRVVTRGDDMPAADPPLPHAAIVGRVPIAPSPRALYCAVRALLRF